MGYILAKIDAVIWDRKKKVHKVFVFPSAGKTGYVLHVSKERMDKIKADAQVRLSPGLIGRKVALDKISASAKIAILPKDMEIREPLGNIPFLYNKNGDIVEVEFV